MRPENIFKGLGVALITPFAPNGEIDETALRDIVEQQLEQGIDFLCVLGTTAETPCLSSVEKERIRQIVTRTNRGRVPLLLGCGGNNTAAVAKSLCSTDRTGIDGVLQVCPYYNKPSQEGLFQHFKAISQASPLPIVLYNIPGRTGVNMTAETTLRLAHECPNIMAVKEASGNLAQIEAILQDAPQGFDVLSGDDAITLELLAAGAAGVISVVGNAYPQAFGQLVRHALKGELNAARQLQHALSELFKLLSVDGNPAGIKCLLSLLKRCENIVRLPLVTVRPETREKMAAWVAAPPAGLTL